MPEYDFLDPGSVELEYFVDLFYLGFNNGDNDSYLPKPKYGLEYVKLAKELGAVACYSKELDQDGILLVCVKNKLTNKLINARELMVFYPYLKVESFFGDFWGIKQVFFNFSMAESLDDYLENIN